MKKYSEFINFPIRLWASKEVDVEVPADEDDSTDEEEKCKITFLYYSFVGKRMEDIALVNKVKSRMIFGPRQPTSTHTFLQ